MPPLHTTIINAIMPPLHTTIIIAIIILLIVITILQQQRLATGGICLLSHFFCQFLWQEVGAGETTRRKNSKQDNLFLESPPNL